MPMIAIEKMRLKYNRETKSLSLMGKGGKSKIDNLLRMEMKIAKITPPKDFSSPYFIQTLAIKNRSKGISLRTNTKNVGRFFSGEAAHYSAFIKSILRKF